MSTTKTQFDIGENLSKSTELLDDAAYIFAIGDVVTKIIYAIIFLLVVYIMYMTIKVPKEKFYPINSIPANMQRILTFK